MGEACDKKREDAVRARVRALATESVERGAPTAWFDALYREAGGDASRVPWADLRPNTALAAWAANPRALSHVKTAAVVGCGLGHDAEFLAARRIGVTAFDVSPAAISWAQKIHPRSKVRYEVADLFALPRAWHGKFDLVVEIYTLQALPRTVRGDAARAVVSLLRPGGRLFVFARLRDDGPGAPPFDERTGGPPWPLGRAEIPRLLSGLVPAERLIEVADPADPSIVRAHGVWKKSS